MQVPGSNTGMQANYSSSRGAGSDIGLRGDADKTSLRHTDKSGALATAGVESNTVLLRNESVVASESTQRIDSDVQLSNEGRLLSVDAGRDGTSKDGPTMGSGAAAAHGVESESEKLKVVAEIRELSQRDREVRNHERIHASIAGPHGGAPKFQFQRGPDGVLYAVSGSVSVDLSVVPGNAEATARKAEQIERAALGPSDPSSADRAVAAKARSIANQARIEVANEKSEEQVANDGASLVAGGRSNEQDEQGEHR